METTFPEGESATLTLDLRAPKAFTLALRRPAWAGDGFAVRVNGQAVANLPATRARMSRSRAPGDPGDRVSLTLPKSLRTRAVAPITRRKPS